MTDFGVEALESRELLANLSITDAYLVDGNFQKADTVAIGEQIAVQTEWNTSDIPSDSSYDIQFLVNGVEIRSQFLTLGAGESEGTFSRWRKRWYATSDEHTVTVVLDPDNQIQESDETDNRFTFTFTPETASLPSKMLWPTEATPFEQAAIFNYIDTDPTIGKRDFHGGNATFNSYEGMDIGVANFRQIDSGVVVRSAMDGIVVSTKDGGSDIRGITPDLPLPNYVVIDHGQGWQTVYGQLRKDSVSVQVGQPVAAGHRIGLMGSSILGNGPQIFFGLYRNGRPVETFFDAENYWQEPINYVGDQATVFGSGVSNKTRGFHIQEGGSPLYQFKADANEDVHAWAWFSGLRKGDFVEYLWLRPNGRIHAKENFVVAEDLATSHWEFAKALQSLPAIGTWTLEFRVNHEVLATENFEVQNEGAAAIRVEDELGQLIVPNRFSPISFGLNDSEANTVRSFSVINQGSATLEVSGIELPDGFVVIEAINDSLEPGETGLFRVAMDQSRVGHVLGQLIIRTNAHEHAEYSFTIEGVYDNTELPQLEIGIGQREMSEADVIVGKVYRNGPIENAVEVQLVVDLPELIVPPVVEIEAGQTYALFPIKGINDFAKDGTKIVTITATATNHLPSSAKVNVNELPAIDVIGTDGDDLIIVKKRERGIEVIVNGIRQFFSSEKVYELNIDAFEGTDEIRFKVGNEGVTGWLGSNETKLVSPSFIIHSANGEKLRLIGKKPTFGENRISLLGSTHDDLIVFKQNAAIMHGGDYFKFVDGFEHISATGEQGNDRAIIYGSDGNDRLFAKPSSSTLLGPKYSTRAIEFENVSVRSKGGNDLANIFDSDGDDVFAAQRGFATISGNDYRIEMRNFRRVISRATNGGNDKAVLRGSDLDDRFTGRSTFGLLKAINGDYLMRAIRFEHVNVIAGGGNDIGNLFDSKGDDTFRGQATKSLIRGDDFEHTLIRFDRINAKATQGDDVALLIDGTGNDKFHGLGKRGILIGQQSTFLNYTIGFDHVVANSRNGGIDYLSVEHQIVYRLDDRGDWVS